MKPPTRPTDPPSADRWVACRHLLRRVIATVLLSMGEKPATTGRDGPSPSGAPQVGGHVVRRPRAFLCRVHREFSFLSGGGVGVGGSSRPRLCAAIVDRLTFTGNIIETGTGSYRLAHALAARNGGDTRKRNGRHQVSPPRSRLGQPATLAAAPRAALATELLQLCERVLHHRQPGRARRAPRVPHGRGVHPATALGWFTDSLGFVTYHPGPGE